MAKITRYLLVICFVFVLAGCCTVKNSAIGVAAVGKGLWDDTKNTWDTMCKIDDWMQKNAW